MRSKNWLLLAAVFCFLQFQNCGSPVHSTSNASTQQLVVTQGAFGSNPTPTPIPITNVSLEPNYGVNKVIDTLQPALAIRGAGCFFCHANVSGNVLSDFGYGDPFYFGGNPGNDMNGTYSSQIGWSPGGNWISTTWAQKINLYVPQTPATAGPSNSETLAQWMQDVMKVSTESTGTAAAVSEISSIYIGAPTADRIRQIGSLGKGTLITYIPNKSDSPALSGLSPQNGGAYFGNGKAPVICDGDVVIDGVVWLHNLNLATYSGCRIYSTRSIFVNGPITYSTTIDSQTQNIQLVAANMVAMGYGHGGADSYSYLLPGSSLALGPSRGSTGPAKQALLQADADVIGSTLSDATTELNGHGTEFTHILIDASVFLSQYTGDMHGTIISELAFSARGTTSNYSFDPIFTQIPALPLLNPSEYLDANK